MAADRVWTGFDLTVEIYRSSQDGVRLNSYGEPEQGAQPIVDYCYFQRADLLCDLAIVRRAVTGRRFKRISAQQHEYEMRVDFFHLSKAHDLNMADVFNRDYWLEIVMRYEKFPGAIDTDEHVLHVCKGDWRISTEENGVAQGSARFQGEYFT